MNGIFDRERILAWTGLSCLIALHFGGGGARRSGDLGAEQ
jgi:hypothetical protein